MKAEVLMVGEESGGSSVLTVVDGVSKKFYSCFSCFKEGL